MLADQLRTPQEHSVSKPSITATESTLDECNPHDVADVPGSHSSIIVVVLLSYLFWSSSI